MITNDTLAGDTANDTAGEAFRDLKRRVRKVKARLRKRGHRGGAKAAQPIDRTPTGSSTSAELREKDSAPPPLITVNSVATTVLTREDSWRAAGDIQATIVKRSLNDRILDVLLPSGARVSAIIKPSEHRKFGVRKPVWVKKDPNGKHYLVVGGYSQWGVRHS